MNKIEEIRHSLAHILAMAAKNKKPEVKLGIGPVIENGFYYDFDFSETGCTPSPECLPKLEKSMRHFIKQNLAFEKKEISYKEAERLNADEPFKLELINELKEKKESIFAYKSGDFTDICAGPHVESTNKIDPQAFKLTKIAGAYWRGDEKNKMLTRIYGVAFESKEKLDEYLQLQEEAEKRDHRKIGKELDLFSLHEEGPGFPFWHPKGLILYKQLENFIRKENDERGYEEISTPILLNKSLWVTSGHWEKFKESMYFTEIDEKEFSVKPMSCPGGLLIYGEKLHSYRDMPVRFAEFGLVHRHELSGTLHGILRVRSFTQDDAHSYCMPNQLEEEIIGMVDYAIDTYKTFGFDDYEIFIATKPEKYIGENDVWDKATEALEEALKKKGLDFKIKEGEGAFYGPKIEFNVKDAIGRNWQLGTIQVDFSMPARFEAFYIDDKGKKQTPVMIHRAILGSLERFIGVLIEHYAGAFPVWLSPVQATIVPVSEKFNEYGNKVLEELKKAGVRVEIDDSDETLGKRIRAAEKQKTPYILVVGEKEKTDETVAIRARGEEKKQEILKLSEFVEKISIEIKEKRS